MVGYFNDELKEYVITDMHPRRPLENYLWNEEFFGKCGIYDIYIDGRLVYSYSVQ